MFKQLKIYLKLCSALKVIIMVFGNSGRAAFVMSVGSDWESVIVNGTWKCVDTHAAVTILEEHKENVSAEVIIALKSSTDEEYDIKRKGSEFVLTQSWPLHDNSDRAIVLTSIQNVLRNCILLG